ncbi:uncharacterized protein LOC123533675 [Mercenaria mercenaria]|uniref:uncharacterized protein LOC123533675 n=1 Tax=Mercenaria mercenaria TaxID=6596 RepID=UPI00234F7EF0|nr:uncharacterized protein LOC123533675 [Mercenaria mercenaria]
MEVDLQPSIQDDSDVERPCLLCKKLCNKKKRTGYSVSSVNYVRYGIQESDVQPDTLICLTCHFRHAKIIKSTADKENQIKVDKKEVNKGTGGEIGVTETIKTIPKSVKNNETMCGAVKDKKAICTELKSEEPVFKLMKSSEPVHNEIKNNEPVPNEIKSSEPVSIEVGSSEPVPSEVKSSEPVPNEVKSSEPVPNDVKSSESVSDMMIRSDQVHNQTRSSEPVDDHKCEKQYRCSASLCTAAASKKIYKLKIIPKRFFTLPADVKQIIKSQCGILDERKRICKSCYDKVYFKCINLTKINKKIEIPSCSNRNQWKDSLKQSISEDTQNQAKTTKTYACGWCKFRSARSSTIVKHHYNKHQRRELDIVRLKSRSPKIKSPSGIGFNCDSCDFTGRLRHQLHLHNDRYHQNSLNRDGTTDCESDNSQVYPYYFYNMTLPSNYFQMQQKYKLKDFKILCEDILKSGPEYLIKTVSDEGVSKLCVDSLTEDEFVSMATMYHEDISYCDTRVENCVPVDMGKLELQEIETMIRN